MKKILIFIFAIAILLFPSFKIVKAGDYDIYVDESYDGDDSDGSSEKPYKTLEKAIEESDSQGEKIYIKDGTYSEKNLDIPSGVEITGESKEGTIIQGSTGLPTLIAKGNNTIKNLTITGGSHGILFEKKGTLDSCIVKNASKDGVNFYPDAKDITVRNSTITKNGKGFYAQKNSSYTISNNSITSNGGEGIDIRDRTDGSISGNTITSNEESGIEIIVGGSDVAIRNNTIKKNGASGIAAQFYSEASKTGEIEISKNTISNNDIYGIICKSPSGGDSSKGYYNKSLEINDNKIERNKRKSIAGACKIIEAVTEEEEKKNQTVESETAKVEPEATAEEEKITEEEKAEIERVKEEERKLQEKITSLNNSVSEIDSKNQKSFDSLFQVADKIKKRNRVTLFFLGPDLEKVNSAKEEIAKIEETKTALNEAATEFENAGNSEKRDEINGKIEQLNSQLEFQKSFIDKEENKFSLFGWIYNFFGK